MTKAIELNNTSAIKVRLGWHTLLLPRTAENLEFANALLDMAFYEPIFVGKELTGCQTTEIYARSPVAIDISIAPVTISEAHPDAIREWRDACEAETKQAELDALAVAAE